MTQDPLTVVGTDFSPCSEVALRQAVRLASGTPRKVRAVHAIDDPSAAVDMELGDPAADQQEWISHANWAWGEFSRDVEGASEIPFEAHIGSRARTIIENARKHGADLLVLGAFGDRRPDVGFGTVATTCVRQAHCDVLLVRDTQPGRFRRIVVGIDFSEGAARALERALMIAQHDDAQLHVLHVFDPPWQRLHYRAPTLQTSPAEQGQFRQELERRTREFAGRALRPKDLERTHFDIIDAPAHRSGIVEHAQAIDADLVVLGTRGRTNLRDLLLGSTAEKVLAESRCSVLAVRS